MFPKKEAWFVESQGVQPELEKWQSDTAGKTVWLKLMPSASFFPKSSPDPVPNFPGRTMLL